LHAKYTHTHLDTHQNIEVKMNGDVSTDNETYQRITPETCDSGYVGSRYPPTSISLLGLAKSQMKNRDEPFHSQFYCSTIRLNRLTLSSRTIQIRLSRFNSKFGSRKFGLSRLDPIFNSQKRVELAQPDFIPEDSRYGHMG